MRVRLGKVPTGRTKQGANMTAVRAWAGGLRYTSLLAVALILSGCGDFEMPKFNFGSKANENDETITNTDTSIRLVERDVEAPQVFQVTEAALWDGRPSLGGVWVAYPGDIQPERVIIRNTENKKFVIGALFKRERDNPGPKIQLSSDAAAALGILAGNPTTLNVTALRRESVPEATDSTTDTADAETTEDSLGAIATAAIDEAEGKKATPEPIETTTVSALAKPYIQIGIFSVETNARNTATSFSTDGIVPVVKAQESKGKKFWRVLIGPAANKADRAALLKKARALGFDDAYFVSN